MLGSLWVSIGGVYGLLMMNLPVAAVADPRSAGNRWRFPFLRKSLRINGTTP